MHCSAIADKTKTIVSVKMNYRGHNLNNIIIIFHCGLMVHITDTRSQKVVSYTSAHITETMFAHDQH